MITPADAVFVIIVVASRVTTALAAVIHFAYILRSADQVGDSDLLILCVRSIWPGAKPDAGVDHSAKETKDALTSQALFANVPQ